MSRKHDIDAKLLHGKDDSQGFPFTRRALLPIIKSPIGAVYRMDFTSYFFFARPPSTDFPESSISMQNVALKSRKVNPGVSLVSPRAVKMIPAFWSSSRKKP